MGNTKEAHITISDNSIELNTKGYSVEELTELLNSLRLTMYSKDDKPTDSSESDDVHIKFVPIETYRPLYPYVPYNTYKVTCVS